MSGLDRDEPRRFRAGWLRYNRDLARSVPPGLRWGCVPRRVWYDSDSWSGCHPWEIRRGGNATHIDLAPVRRGEGWNLNLCGGSTARMVEVIRMALALHDRGLPVEVADDESVAYGWQGFPKEVNVFDCCHYRDLGPARRRLAPFITWSALPLVAPAAGASGRGRQRRRAGRT